MLKKIFIIFICLLVISWCSYYNKNSEKKDINEKKNLQKHIKTYKVPIKDNPDVPSW